MNNCTYWEYEKKASNNLLIKNKTGHRLDGVHSKRPAQTVNNVMKIISEDFTLTCTLILKICSCMGIALICSHMYA